MSNTLKLGKYISLFFMSVICLTPSFSQDYSPENGVHDPKNTTYVLTGCKIVVSADKTLPIGMLVVKNGVIQNVGIVEIPPRDAVKINLSGYTIYPSFIDMYSSEGMPKPVRRKRNGPQLNSLNEGPYYWNEAVKPEVNAYELYKDNNFKSKNQYRKAGFGVISTHSGDGILRGTSVLIALSENETVDNVIRAKSANHYSFSKGVSGQSYPSSQMGCIALIRQFLYDAQWFSKLNQVHKENVSLQAGLDNLELP